MTEPKSTRKNTAHGITSTICTELQSWKMAKVRTNAPLDCEERHKLWEHGGLIPGTRILAASRRLLLSSGSKGPFAWLISISWKCSVTRMAEVVRQQSWAVLTARLHHRSWCWTTLVSLWAAPLCLLCRADRFMLITPNQDWEPIKKSYWLPTFLSPRVSTRRQGRHRGNLNSLEINGKAMIDGLIGCCSVWQFDESKCEDFNGL